MFHLNLSRCSAILSRQALSLRWCSTETTKIDFDQLTKNKKVVIFMKGIPSKPRCGYSQLAVEILKHYGVDFDSHNVLDNWEVRQGIKKFSNWPTIPQIYVDGNFVGGSDTLLQMHKNGELEQIFKRAGIDINIKEEPKIPSAEKE